jgi:hypothetical protein
MAQSTTNVALPTRRQRRELAVRRRAAPGGLGALLLRQPDLLLDEPSNHLDAESV